MNLKPKYPTTYEEEDIDKEIDEENLKEELDKLI